MFRIEKLEAAGRNRARLHVIYLKSGGVIFFIFSPACIVVYAYWRAGECIHWHILPTSKWTPRYVIKYVSHGLRFTTPVEDV